MIGTRTRRKAPRREEGGAALVELALVTPFLVILLLGVIEFGWLLSQAVDVRSGAREGARLVAVNGHAGPGQDTRIIRAVCDSMDARAGTVVLARAGNSVAGRATATVRVPAGQNTLTGFLSWAIPPSMQISQTVETRIVKLPTWTNGATGSC